MENEGALLKGSNFEDLSAGTNDVVPDLLSQMQVSTCMLWAESRRRRRCSTRTSFGLHDPADMWACSAAFLYEFDDKISILRSSKGPIEASNIRQDMVLYDPELAALRENGHVQGDNSTIVEEGSSR